MQFIIQGKPIPQKRSRTFVRGGKALHYNSQREQEQCVQEAVKRSLPIDYEPYPLNTPLKLIIRWCIGLPKSYSRKKKVSLAGTPHTNKPDCSNLQKFYEDALNGILWVDDCIIAQTITEKVWAYEPMTILKIVPMDVNGRRRIQEM